jgi:hypothetical protein
MTDTCSADYHAIIEVLKDLVAQRRSGTLFITSAEKHAAHFVLKDGVVCACGYRFKRGMAAVEAIRRMTGGSYRFEANIVCAKSTTDLPDTHSLLALLDDVEPPANTTPAATGAAPIATPPRMAPLVAMVQEQLTQYLGPVAAICCEDYLDRTGGIHGLDEIKDMIHTLSEEIDDTAERREFEEASLGAVAKE